MQSQQQPTVRPIRCTSSTNEKRLLKDIDEDSLKLTLRGLYYIVPEEDSKLCILCMNTRTDNIDTSYENKSRRKTTQCVATVLRITRNRCPPTKHITL